MKDSNAALRAHPVSAFHFDPIAVYHPEMQHARIAANVGGVLHGRIGDRSHYLAIDLLALGIDERETRAVGLQVVKLLGRKLGCRDPPFV